MCIHVITLRCPTGSSFAAVHRNVVDLKRVARVGFGKNIQCMTQIKMILIASAKIDPIILTARIAIHTPTFSE